MFFVFFLASLFSVLSTAVMLYIAMATPVGPWIAPTIALFSLIVLSVIHRKNDRDSRVAAITAASSIGGILATAIGFSFPTLYFLDRELFMQQLTLHPFSFIGMLILLAGAAGWFGLFLANTFEYSVLNVQQLPFPVGQLVAKLIVAKDRLHQSCQLMIGFFSSLIFSLLQDGCVLLAPILPRSITLFSAYSYGCFMLPRMTLDLWPMMWAIGFVTGHVVAIPLLIGALTRYILLVPIYNQFFSSIDEANFLIAFCGGLVVASALVGFKGIVLRFFHWSKMQSRDSSYFVRWYQLRNRHDYRSTILEAFLIMIFLVTVLSYFRFSFYVQLYLIVGTIICTYQMVVIAGKIGLAQLGRFATFVMVPALFFFTLDNTQIVVIATFVEIAGGVAADILSGRVMGKGVNVSRKQIISIQYLGLLVSVIAVGISFWFLVSHLQLGSAALFAHRAQARQLLIQAHHFHVVVLSMGILFGLVLHGTKCNPLLVLGGLLMPFELSAGLIAGGLLTFVVSNKGHYYPFWSGVFVMESLLVLIRALVG